MSLVGAGWLVGWFRSFVAVGLIRWFVVVGWLVSWLVGTCLWEVPTGKKEPDMVRAARNGGPFTAELDRCKDSCAA